MDRTSRLSPVSTLASAAAPMILGIMVLAVFGCGGSSMQQGSGMGAANISLSDPPSCLAPSGDFSHVYITIRSVQAHISSSANDGSGGWQELAPQLVSQPRQVDLLNLPVSGGCLLTQLGSTTALPAGDYQQIRLLLLANSAPSGSAPASNACADAGLGQVFNCVIEDNGTPHRLELNSQANTGLKIPPGQVAGGPIRVAEGQTVDINIDFNACASLVPLPNGNYRLRPTLNASQVSPNTTGLSGQVVDSATLQPIAGALVAIEQADSTGTDRIFMQAATDGTGHFIFCPLPSGALFDVVVVSVNGSVAYHAAVVVGVGASTALPAMRLVAQGAGAVEPGIIEGQITAVNGATGPSIDAAMSALQTIPLPGGGTRRVTIPLGQAGTATSTPLVSVESGAPCSGGTPPGASCAEYTMVVPAGNPGVGALQGGSINFSPPPAGDVLYTVEARASVPLSGGTPMCTPAVQSTMQDSASAPLKVIAGSVTTASRLDFTGCT